MLVYRSTIARSDSERTSLAARQKIWKKEVRAWNPRLELQVSHLAEESLLEMLHRAAQWFQLSLLDWISRKPSSKPPRHINAAISAPELEAIWLQLVGRFFPDREDIRSYTIRWSSRRQRRVLASCHIGRRVVKVAQELRDPSHQKWLEPLLYHEMCHAILGKEVERRGKKRAWHGNKFKELESRHPEIKALDAWIRSGGWTSAVRSHRAKASHAKRRKAAFD